MQSSLQFENRRFTYSELETITNNFETLLGEGGTASVFRGVLEEGTQVAVKLLSGLPEQVPEEFLTEVGFLRVYVVRVLIEICIWTTIKSLTAHEI